MSARWMTLCCLTAAMSALATSGSAKAEACGDAADGCPKGFDCGVVGSSGGCAIAEPGCPADDPKCTVPAFDAGACTSQDIMGCVPADCTADTDCGDGMVCREESWDECSGGGSTDIACEKGADCPAPEPFDAGCVTKTAKTCTPKYLLPCETAADCGEGFTCDAPTQCACAVSGGTASGSGAEPSPGAGDAFAAPVAVDAGTDKVAAGDAGAIDPSCECKPSDGPKSCQLEEIPCDTAADCPASWTCEASGGDTISTCAVGRPTIAFVDGGVQSFDASVPDCTTETTEVTHQCMPPYADLVSRGFANDSAGAPLSASGGGDAKGESSQTADGHAADAGTEADAGAGKTDDSGLCSVARVGGPSESGAAGLLLGLVGIALALRRRARR